MVSFLLCAIVKTSISVQLPPWPSIWMHTTSFTFYTHLQACRYSVPRIWQLSDCTLGLGTLFLSHHYRPLASKHYLYHLCTISHTYLPSYIATTAVLWLGGPPGSQVALKCFTNLLFSSENTTYLYYKVPKTHLKRFLCLAFTVYSAKSVLNSSESLYTTSGALVLSHQPLLCV